MTPQFTWHKDPHDPGLEYLVDAVHGYLWVWLSPRLAVNGAHFHRLDDVSERIPATPERVALWVALRLGV